MITPSSILAIIFLDFSQTELTLSIIYNKSKQIINLFKKIGLPLSNKLQFNFKEQIKIGLKYLITFGIIKENHNINFNTHFFYIENKDRLKISYYKNNVLHHLVPYFIMSLYDNKDCINKIKNPIKLNFIHSLWKELHFDFYLPEYQKIIKNNKIRYYNKEERMFFINLFIFKYESLYMIICTILYLNEKQYVSITDLWAMAEVVFKVHFLHGPYLNRSESLCIPGLKNNIKYLLEENILYQKDNKYKLIDKTKLRSLKERIIVWLGHWSKENWKLGEMIDDKYYNSLNEL